MIQCSVQECSVGFLSTARKQQPEVGPVRGAAVVTRTAGQGFQPRNGGTGAGPQPGLGDVALCLQRNAVVISTSIKHCC